MTALLIIIVIGALVIGHHLGHAHANYRHGRAHGRRGVNLYWSSVRGPYPRPASVSRYAGRPGHTK